MVYYENLENLKNFMSISEGKKGIHKTNNVNFLPFKTRATERPRFKCGFSGVVGESIRLMNSKMLNKEFNLEDNIKNIIVEVEYEKEDEKYLKELIKDYLVDKNGNINIFHPKILNYIQVSDTPEGDGEKEIASFLHDIFLKDINLEGLFSDSNGNDLITNLILEKINGLENQIVKNKYNNKLPHISLLIKEDLEFLAKNKDFFVKGCTLLLAYYYFYYITQLSFKLNRKFKENTQYSEVEGFYYLLDWEKPGKNRKSDLKGYKWIKSAYKNLLINMNILAHMNFIFGVEGLSYEEIRSIYINSSETTQQNYLETMKKWVEIYRETFSLPEKEIVLDFDKIIYELEQALLIKLHKEKPGTLNRYALYIEEIGKAYFLKRRGGTYGFMLNLTQEMVLLLVAVSIKEEKITLKALFIEFEKRGIFLDQYSKELVTELLAKLNLIDKKSDSGDAQYVKSIL